MPEALDALAEWGDEGKALAGGQSLVPLMNLRLAQPAALIDLNRLPELDYISVQPRTGVPGVAIGALTRQRQVEEAGDLLGRLPLLADAIGWVGHPQIRNRGTVGGSIAHADPAAELPLVFRALDGMATVRSKRGERRIPASDFFRHAMTPALEPDELLLEVWLPLPASRTRSAGPRPGHPLGDGPKAHLGPEGRVGWAGQAFLEVARRHGDFALVACAASLTVDQDGVCTEARIAIGGAAPVPIRMTAAEEALVGQRPTVDLFRAASRIVASQLQPGSDVHADAQYRRDVAGALTQRALALAFQRVPNTEP